MDNIVEEHKCFVPSIMLLYYATSFDKASQGIGLAKRRYMFTDWVTLYNARDKRSNLNYYLRVLLLYFEYYLFLLELEGAYFL